jgi:SAM-dependent methyltransferase
MKTLLLIALLVATRLSCAQTAPSRPEIERSVATLPEERRAYERFWSWVSELPANERGTGESAEFHQDALLQKYKSWLVDTGSSFGDADKEIATLRKRGSAEVAEFWNRYLVQKRAQWLNSEPNGFLVEMVKGRKPGKALDVAMGQGRNAIWLAQQGWDVTGFDPADQAIAVAQEEAKRRGVTIHTEVTTMEQFDFGENKWDLIVLSYAGCSDMAAQVQKALKPGGILIEEAFHTDALKTMKIGGSLCKPAQLANAFQELRVIRYEEPIAKPDFAPQPARVVRFAAEKPLP